MPEFGSYKKKNEDRKKKSSEVVSAYSKEGQQRKKRSENLNKAFWIAGLLLGLIAFGVLIYFVLNS